MESNQTTVQIVQSGPKPQTPIWDVSYFDHDGKKCIKEVAGTDTIDAISEFNLFYGDECKVISRITERTDRLIPSQEL